MKHRSETPDLEEFPCSICGSYECKCPECPQCGGTGDPNCYLKHGLYGNYAKRIDDLEHALESLYTAYALEYHWRQEKGLGDEEIDLMKGRAQAEARLRLPILSDYTDDAAEQPF